MLNFRDYHITGPFLFSAMHPLPLYRLEIMQRFYIFAEVRQYEFMRAHPWEFLSQKLWVYYFTFLFGFGLLLFPGLIYLARRCREGMLIAPLLAFTGFVINLLLMAWSPFPQYAAPASPVMILIVVFGLSALRRLRWKLFSGLGLVRGLVLGELMLGFSLFGLRIANARDFQEPQYVSKDRARVANDVLRRPGKQLCLVRYTPEHEAWQEWVFNGADLQNERLVWARSLSPESDRKVIAAFPGRDVWLVQPDYAGDLLSPYPIAGSQSIRNDLPWEDAAIGRGSNAGLGARDIYEEFHLPSFEDQAAYQLWSSVNRNQVLLRARMLELDRRSATNAWADAETTFRNAESFVESPLPPAPVLFTGHRVSELNALIGSAGVDAVKVTSSELEMDAPLRISREGISVDLGAVKLRIDDNRPYLIEIENARDVSLRGGSIEGGNWGILVAGSTHVAVLNMDITGLFGGGILVTRSQDIVIWANRIHQVNGAPIFLHGATDHSTVAHNTIIDNRGSSNWQAGVVITDRNQDLSANDSFRRAPGGDWFKEQPMVQRLAPPHDNVIADNDIGGNRSSGVYSDGGVRNLIVRNRIQNNSKEGACLDNGSAANVVAANLIQGNGSRWGMNDYDLRRDFVFDLGRLPDGTSPAKLPGVSIDNAAYNEVVSNQIARNFGGGIKMVRTAFYNSIGLNTIVNNNEGQNSVFHFFGVELGAAKGDVSSVELNFEASRGNQVFRNTIQGNHYAGIFFADGSDLNQISDNLISGTTEWAMESVIVQRNLMLNNQTNEKLRNIAPSKQTLSTDQSDRQLSPRR